MRRSTFAEASLAQGAAALNRVFEEYLVPIEFSPEQLELHIRYNDVDTRVSPLWFDDAGEVLAAALLAIRGNRGWIGGFGVAAERRGCGFAGALLDEVAERAAQRGLQSISLEVLCENEAAVRLYRKRGFEIVRELRSFEIVSEGTALPAGFEWSDVTRFLDEPDAVPPCWQRERATLQNGAVTHAVTNGGGTYALFRTSKYAAQVLKLGASNSQALIDLASAVAADSEYQTVFVLNEPSESPIVPYAQSAGWNEPFTQYEMRLAL